jgi:hypothetical protein
MAAAAERHALDVQVSSPEAGAKGFKPLPLRWRIEATFGTQTNRYRRLTRNLEQSPKAAEDAVEIANFHRVLRAYSGDHGLNASSNRLSTAITRNAAYANPGGSWVMRGFVFYLWLMIFDVWGPSSVGPETPNCSSSPLPTPRCAVPVSSASCACRRTATAMAARNAPGT